MHISSIPLNPFTLPLCISFSCGFFSPHSYFPTVTLLFLLVSFLTLQFTGPARLEYLEILLFCLPSKHLTSARCGDAVAVIPRSVVLSVVAGQCKSSQTFPVRLFLRPEV
jgi:hypothetical protein